MIHRTFLRALASFFVLTGIALSLIGCGSEPQNAVTISYTFPVIPVTLSLDSNGNISFSVGANIVTELGEFAVSAGSTITPFSGPANSLILTIRHKQNGNLVDTGYQIDTGGVGSADVQGNISEVKVGWNGANNTIFIDASNGDISSIVIQGTTSSTNSAAPTPIPQFQCPSADQVSGWMNVGVSQVAANDNCAFYAGDVQGQTLRGVICTTQAGGTTIEYTPVDEPKTLVVKNCDGNELPEIYGFTIRFIEGYPSSGPYSANVCAIAQAARGRQGPDPIPADWTVQADC